MDSLRRLEEIFAHFPGIGPRQARRFVYYLMNKSPAFIKEFTQLIEEVKKSTVECGQCHRFFLQSQSAISHTPNSKSSKLNGSNHSPLSTLHFPACQVCSDPNRDNSVLMVVARDSDFETIEKSSAYRGLYFILGGTVPILDADPEKRIRLEKLLKYVKDSNDSGRLKEIILSLNATPDGEHTATIVKEAIVKVIGDKKTKISVLGRGLSTGSELEYADGETIKNALRNRS